MSQEPAAAAAERTPVTSLEQSPFAFAQASRFMPADTEGYDVFLIGCGGNGSELAPKLARMAALMRRRGERVSLYFIDPDRVEAKNLDRQNFCRAERGLYKAETLANRFAHANGVAITAVAAPFKASYVRDLAGHSQTLKVLVGCVDNAAARLEIAHAARDAYGHKLVWLDLGNNYDSGQVLIGGATEEHQLRRSFPVPGICTQLPCPAVLEPELVNTRKKKARRRKILPCAEAAEQNLQSDSVNPQMAAIAYDYLHLLMVRNDLRKFATYASFTAGTTESYYITTDNISAVTGIPAEVLAGYELPADAHAAQQDELRAA
jgi:PRTRC genetic system ThiF family protein